MLVAGQLSAQARTIPEELALVLLGGRGTNSANITVGELPPGFPADFKLPPNARLVGGLSAGRSTSSAIIALPGNTAAARTAVEAALTSSGWTARPAEPQRPQSGFQSGGFQATRETAGMVPQVYCSAAAQIGYSTWARTTEQTYVRLDHTPIVPSRYNPCDASAVRNVFDNVPLPLLRHPEGARQGSAGSGGGSDGREAHAEIEAAETAKELIDHYTPQMREAGWTQVTRNDAADASLATFTMRKDNRDWRAVLIAVQFPNTQSRDVSVRVSAPR
jgi:hypothetical protein